MTSQDIKISKEDFKALYEDVLLQSTDEQKELANVVATAFLLGSTCKTKKQSKKPKKQNR